MKSSYFLVLACCLFSPATVSAQPPELASTIWLTEPTDWVHRPPDPELDPQRSGFASVIFFHRDGALTRLEAALIEGLHPERRYLAISQGDGFLLYFGAWTANASGAVSVEYEFLAGDKVLGPIKRRTVRAAGQIGPGMLELSDSTFFAPHYLFPLPETDFAAAYLQYICGVLEYHQKQVPECGDP